LVVYYFKNLRADDSSLVSALTQRNSPSDPVIMKEKREMTHQEREEGRD